MPKRRSLAVAFLLSSLSCGFYTDGDDDGDYCFAAGTQVSTPAGSVAIEDVRPGDLVLSVAGGVVVPSIVTKVVVHRAQRFRVIDLPGGARLGVTDDHPIFERETNRFVPARELTPAARLVVLAGGGDRVEVRRGAVVAGEGRGDVYDLTVAGAHNFFAEGVLVHNKSPGADSGPPFPDAGPCGEATTARCQPPPPDAGWCGEETIMACQAWDGPEPTGIHGLLISGCDVPGCCPGPLTAWAAGVFREEPQPGTIAGPLAMDAADADGRFELAARRPPVFLCAGEPQDGEQLRVETCVRLDATRRSRWDFVIAPTGAWLDCAAQ